MRVEGAIVYDLVGVDDETRCGGADEVIRAAKKSLGDLRIREVRLIWS